MNFVEIEYKERDAEWAMSKLQSHDYYELYLLIDGKREFFFEDKVFSLTAPTFSVIPPFTMHKTTGGSYKRVNVNISAELLSERERAFLDKLASGIAFALSKEDALSLSSLLAKGSEIMLADNQEKHSLTLSFVHAALYILESCKLESLDYNEDTKGKRSDTAALEVVAYINEHYRESLTLENISERFYMSKNTLCSKFRSAMHCSVMEYLSFVRINRAKELLATTDMGMEEISELCGYSSANYFSLTFKRSVGISPSGYRQAK